MLCKFRRKCHLFNDAVCSYFIFKKIKRKADTRPEIKKQFRGALKLPLFFLLRDETGSDISILNLPHDKLMGHKPSAYAACQQIVKYAPELQTMMLYLRDFTHLASLPLATFHQSSKNEAPARNKSKCFTTSSLSLASGGLFSELY